MFNFGKYTEAVIVGIIGLVGVIGVTSPRVNDDATSNPTEEAVIEAQAEETNQDAASEDTASNQAEENEGENSTEEAQTADANSEETAENAEEETADNSDADNSDTAPDDAPLVGIIKPSVEVSRFDGDMATIAGTATPNSTVVAKLANGEEIGSVQAGADGQFALVAPFVTPEEGAIINIETIGEGGETVTARGAITVLPSLNNEGTTDVVNIDEEGINLPTGNADLGFSSLEYGVDEPALASGYGLPGSLIDIIVDGVNLGQATVGEDGKWQFEIPSLSEGDHQLELAMNGETALDVDISRNAIIAANESTTNETTAENSTEETSTKENTPEENAEGENDNATDTQAASTSIQDTRYTVIRGDSLWRIAKEEFGEGLRYVDIYNANTNQINDPDLIYPGQELIIRAE